MRGYEVLLIFHHCSGHALRAMGASLVYSSNSCWTEPCERVDVVVAAAPRSNLSQMDGRGALDVDGVAGGSATATADACCLFI